jgi:ABC-type branched-subunit amino acid transport system substrate-binding protein
MFVPEIRLNEMADKLHRRRVIKSIGITGVIGLAGCASTDGGDGDGDGGDDGSDDSGDGGDGGDGDESMDESTDTPTPEGDGDGDGMDDGEATDTPSEDGGDDGGSSPDVVNVIGYPTSGVQLFRDYYSMRDGSQEDIIVPDGLQDADMQAEIGNEMRNVTGTVPAGAGPNYDAFASLFEDEMGSQPSVFTAHTFDAVSILMLANAAAGENAGPAIRDQMRNVANPGGMEVGANNLVEGINAAANGENVNYQGASSATNFDQRGDPAASAYNVWEFAPDTETGINVLDTIEFEGDTGGPSSDSMPGGTDRTLMVGLILPESGDLAPVGGPMISAGELAAQVASEGDTNVEVDLSFEDTQTDAQAGISAAESLVNQGYPCIAGPASSGVNVPVSKQVFIPNQVVSCSPSSTALSVSFLEDDDFVFRTAPSDLLQGQVMARVAAEQLGAETTSTMYVNNDYGQQLSDQYTQSFTENHGGEVWQTVAFEKEQSAYTSRIQEVLSDSS